MKSSRRLGKKHTLQPQIFLQLELSSVPSAGGGGKAQQHIDPSTVGVLNQCHSADEFVTHIRLQHCTDLPKGQTEIRMEGPGDHHTFPEWMMDEVVLSPEEIHPRSSKTTLFQNDIALPMEISRENPSPSTTSRQQNQNSGRHDHLLEPLPDERIECNPVDVSTTPATSTKTDYRKSPVAKQESPTSTYDEQPTVATQSTQEHSKSKGRSSVGSQGSSKARREREMKKSRSSRTIGVDDKEDLTPVLSSESHHHRRRRGTSVGAATARRTRSTTSSPSSSSRRLTERTHHRRSRKSVGPGPRIRSRTSSPSHRRSERSTRSSNAPSGDELRRGVRPKLQRSRTGDLPVAGKIDRHEDSVNIGHKPTSRSKRPTSSSTTHTGRSSGLATKDLNKKDPTMATDSVNHASRRRRPRGSETSKRKESSPSGLSSSMRY